MNRTWIGCHRSITIRPIVKLWTYLISPQCDFARRQKNDGCHICLHYWGSCSRTWAEGTSWVVHLKTRARSRAKAVELDLLVAYPVINSHALGFCTILTRLAIIMDPYTITTIDWRILLTLPMLRLHLPKAQECKNLWKPSRPCHVGIHWIALTEYSQMSTHVPGFRWFFWTH